MKILIECYTPIESPPVFTYGLAKAMLSNGVDVYASLADQIENKSDWNQLLPPDHIFYLNSKPIRKMTIKDLKEYRRAGETFKETKFDYWFDTFPTGQSGILAHFIEYGESIGIAHDAVPHSGTSLYRKILFSQALKGIDNIVVLSRAYLDLAKRKYKLDDDHIYYMRHGAMEYPEKSEKSTYKDIRNINFLYFGRIDGYKGLHVLASAYKKLKEKHDDVSLTVAGNGDFTAYLSEFAALKDCDVVNRYLSDDDIAYYFNMPNVVAVLPYIDATQSGVIGVAFNYRCPVIVSDTGGMKEQLFGGEMGLLVKPGSADDLLDKMEQFVLNESLYNKQKNLMEIGCQRSTWDNCVKEFLEELKEKKQKEL